LQLLARPAAVAALTSAVAGLVKAWAVGIRSSSVNWGKQAAATGDAAAADKDKGRGEEKVTDNLQLVTELKALLHDVLLPYVLCVRAEAGPSSSSSSSSSSQVTASARLLLVLVARSLVVLHDALEAAAATAGLTPAELAAWADSVEEGQEEQHNASAKKVYDSSRDGSSSSSHVRAPTCEWGCYHTFWMLHDGNIARFRANDRLIGQPPNPLTTNNWILPVTLAHRHAALWQPAPNPDYTRSSPPPLSHCAASFCTINSLLLARFELTPSSSYSSALTTMPGGRVQGLPGAPAELCSSRDAATQRLT
jgi:hypothetical protein